MTAFTPQPPEWTDQAPVRFRASREMLAAADEVWSAIADHASWPEWFDAITHGEATGGEGLGSTRTVTIAGKWPIHEEFIVWDEPKTWSFTVHEAAGPLGFLAESLNERISIQVLAPDRVRVTYLMAFGPRKGRTALVKGLKRGATKNLRSALKGLDAHINARRSS